MYTLLRNDIIEEINKSLGKELPKDCVRDGRIEYTSWIESEEYIKFELEEDEINIKFKEDFELAKKYSNFTDSYENYLERKKIEKLYSIRIKQHYWIKDKYIIASGLKFYSEEYLPVLLRHMFYITDKLGEPSFEDTKTIEWNLINGLKTIIVLPPKNLKNRYYFLIISGKKEFFDKTDVWKTNI